MARPKIITRSIFNERFAQIRHMRGISQLETAELLGISRTTITLYETAKCEPTLSRLALIAETFNVSTDWLLGLTDKP